MIERKMIFNERAIYEITYKIKFTMGGIYFIVYITNHKIGGAQEIRMFKGDSRL